MPSSSAPKPAESPTGFGSPAEPTESRYVKKPSIQKKAINRRVVGAAAVGHKISGLKRRKQQESSLGGHWVNLNGRPVFVKASSSSEVKRKGKPATAADRLARLRDKQKKRKLGQM